MSMMREEIVFGPIYSRRLGSSLGINLLPEKGKLCNFDCIYCECGWNADGRDDRHIPDAEALRHALDLKLRECAGTGAKIDSITFSGDGEPTLNPDFERIIDITLELRDRYYPQAKVSVLTNATRLHRPDVRRALQKVDNPILKLDAPTTELVRKINCPQGEYDVASVVEDMKLFNGDFILQTMFLRSDDFDSSSPEVLDGWMNIVRELRPREVMVYTIARPTPQSGLKKFTEAEMRMLVQPLIDDNIIVKIYE